MARLNHVKQEQDDKQKKTSFKNTQQQNNEGDDASTCQLSVQGPKLVKKEEEEEGIVKQIQPCTKVKKEEGGECKLEWDGDERDCEQCRVDRTIKVEFSQNDATKNQQQANSCPFPSDTKKGVPSQSSVCKRVKKEEDEDRELIGEWDEDCDCDDCRRMRQKAIRSKQTNVMENGEPGGDNDEETEIDEEEFEMEVDGQESSDDEETEQFGNKTIHDDQQPNGQIVQIEEDEETEIEDNQGGDEGESRTLESSRIETNLPHPNEQTNKIVRQSARHLKRKQTDEEQEIATECTTNPSQPNLAQSNRHLQCPHCHKSFDCNSNLQRHVRVHSRERPFPCDLCEKRFRDRSNLTQHQLIHQNIKRFRCPECDKQFTFKHVLDSHLRIHSGGRPFACRHCEKSFTQLATRNMHEQAIHLHVKTYRCKQCGHTATQQTNIIRHIRMIHFGLPKTIKQQQTLNIIDHRDAREFVEKV